MKNTFFISYIIGVYLYIKLKNLISLSIILSFILIFNIAATSPTKNIEVIVKTQKIENPKVAIKLINEFSRMNGVVHAESAYATNTFMIIYKNNALTQKSIESIFSKWGCDEVEISYELLN